MLVGLVTLQFVAVNIGGLGSKEVNVGRRKRTVILAAGDFETIPKLVPVIFTVVVVLQLNSVVFTRETALIVTSFTFNTLMKNCPEVDAPE